MKRLAIALLSFSFVLVLGGGCEHFNNAIEAASPVASAACTIVEAVSSDDTLHRICATERELASLAALARDLRPDSGARRLSRCVVIPKTDVCATRDETAIAIDAVLAGRWAAR